jgi:hypothetical protein
MWAAMAEANVDINSRSISRPAAASLRPLLSSWMRTMCMSTTESSTIINWPMPSRVNVSRASIRTRICFSSHEIR